MIFEPIGNRVLVRRLPIRVDDNGIVKPDNYYNGDEVIVAEGEILAVGPECEVRPGQKVIFNARWNDFTHGELQGSDCDKKGPLERPMPQWQWDKRDLHLITEGDIAGILA